MHTRFDQLGKRILGMMLRRGGKVLNQHEVPGQRLVLWRTGAQTSQIPSRWVGATNHDDPDPLAGAKR